MTDEQTKLCELYKARAEAMGWSAARWGMRAEDRHYVWLNHAIDYSPVFGKGSDNYGEEIEFQGKLFSIFNLAFINASEDIRAST
jgi:hypothetical protein